MNNNSDYKKAIKQAELNLDDLRERRDAALGTNWDDFEKEIFTPEERAASELRVAVMVELTKARNEQGISQKKLEELSGVRQPIIARMERGNTSPQLDTVLKVLAPLGKTLYIGDIQR